MNGTLFKGYSLYNRLVSSMFVLTPFPRGTCTPSRVTVALGSGAVLPKPEKNVLCHFETFELLNISQLHHPVRK